MSSDHYRLAVDWEAVKWSDRVLIGGFLVAIALINIALMTILLVKGYVIRSPRRYIVSSMAFCNVFLALFSLVIEEVIANDDPFDPSPSVNCEIKKMDVTYIDLYFFVTGLSLVVLCVELSCREKIRSVFVNHPLLAGIVLAGVPWILGLVVVLPLGLAGFDMERCGYEEDVLERERARVYVGEIVPLCLAFIFSLSSKLISFTSPSEFYKTRDESHQIDNVETVLQPTQVTNPGASYNANLPTISVPEVRNYPQDSTLAGPPFNNQKPPRYSPTHEINDPAPMPLSLVSPTGMQDSTMSQPPYYPGTIPPTSMQQDSTMPQVHGDSTVMSPVFDTRQSSSHHPQHQQQYQHIPAPVSTQDPTMPQSGQNTEKEKNILLGLSCLYVVLMLPSEIYRLAYMLKDWEVKQSLGIPAEVALRRATFYWLLFWPVISPLVWIVDLVLLRRRNNGTEN